MGTTVELLYDPRALGDVSFVGPRDEAGLAAPLFAIGYVLMALGLALCVWGATG